MAFSDWLRKQARAFLDLENSEMRNAAPKMPVPPEPVKPVVLPQEPPAAGSREALQEPDYDFFEIDNAENTEAYVRRAFDKHLDLMFKSGWTFVFKNDKAFEYLSQRLELMALMTDKPFNILLNEIADNLIKYYNVMIVKARAKQALPNVKAKGFSDKVPIAGYFLAHPGTMKPDIDARGTIKKWVQEVESNKLNFKPTDVIHVYHRKGTGRFFGMPFLASVIEDIKLLREIEDNVATLVYRYTNPLWHYIIGIDSPGKSASPEEIDDLKSKIESMPLDGTLVSSERHAVKVVGVEGEALDVKPYLDYFEQRVFTGLGVSEVDMGRGGAVSRSTSDNMATSMYDRIKALQNVMSIFITERMFFEILLEGGFNPIFDPEDRVIFRFNEIDSDTKIKLENHSQQQYLSNLITLDEARADVGKPATVDEGRLYANLFAKEEPSGNNPTVSEPTNQHSQSLHKYALNMYNYVQPPDTLLYSWNLLRQDIINIINNLFKSKETTHPVTLSIELVKGRVKDFADRAGIEMSSELTKRMMAGLSKGSQDFNVSLKSSEQQRAKAHVVAWLEMNLNDFVDSIAMQITSAVNDKTDVADAVAAATSTLASNAYRLGYMQSYCADKGYWYLYALSAKEAGHKELMFEANGESTCESCLAYNGRTIRLSSPKLLETLAPLHPGCKCKLVPTERRQ